MKITEHDKEVIASVIKNAELKTSGEIVPVILEQSDLYPAAHFRLALIMGILFSFACYYFYDFEDPIFLLWVQIPGMITGYFLAYFPFLKKLLTTQREMSEEVHQRALECFYNNKVSITKDRTGIMIFISLLERKVEVLADCGINEKVSADYWDNLVNALVLKMKEDKIIEGINSSIIECGKSLETFFPIQKDDTNEISDELITE